MASERAPTDGLNDFAPFLGFSYYITRAHIQSFKKVF